MLGQKSFYWQLLTKYVTLFGKIFDDIYIVRFDSNGFKIGDIKVPIQYASIEYMIARVLDDPEIQRQDAELLPRMSFELVSVEYIPDNKTSSVTFNAVFDSNDFNSLFYQFAPVPYNINMLLHVYAKNIDDANQIIEQILPFFTPDWTVNAILIPDTNQDFKIPIVLKKVILDDRWEGDFKKRRVLLWRLEFTIKGWLFGPKYKKPLIKFSNTNLWVTNIITPGNTSTEVTVNTIATATQFTPGLTANGQPTSNVSGSDPVIDIPITSNFGIITNTTDLIP